MRENRQTRPAKLPLVTAIPILAVLLDHLRKTMRRARPPAARHPLSLKDAPRGVACGSPK
jgi:hypothetical protein